MHFDFDNLIDKFMSVCMVFVICFLVFLVILAIIVGIVDVFIDISLDDFMEITHNDGTVIIYRNPSDIEEEDSYIKFKSEGRTYTIFYKDIKSIEVYDKEVAKGVYK